MEQTYTTLDQLSNANGNPSNIRSTKAVLSFAALALVGVLLTGCGGSGGGGASSSAQSPSSTGSTNAEKDLFVAWEPHSDSSVTGYQVAYGPTTETATMVASDLPESAIPPEQLSAKVITVQYKAFGNFRLQAGDQICFRIRAYNPDGITEYSPGVCTTV